MSIQLDGEMRYALTAEGLDDEAADYSDEVSSMVINDQREQHPRAPTYRTPIREQRLGTHAYTAAITFEADLDNDSGLLVLLHTAQLTDSGEVHFSGRWSAAGKTVTGILGVADLDLGTPVGQWKQQSKTFPAREITVLDS